MANDMVKQGNDIKSLMSRVDVKGRFTEILGQNAAAFMSGVISVSQGNKMLQDCEPASILSAAVVAATLKLPVNPSLGQAYIVPYAGKAQFQIGWKGLVQLAMRTGQYQTMNCSEVFDGELISYNRITGDIKFDLTARKSSKIIGFVSYFRLINGFEKYCYMTVEEVEAHAKKFSKTYHKDSSSWKTNNLAMSLKTVMKLLLGKFGILSIEMQLGLQADQSVVKQIEGSEDPFEFEYVDGTTIDAEATVVTDRPTTSTEEEFKKFQKEAKTDVSTEQGKLPLK